MSTNLCQHTTKMMSCRHRYSTFIFTSFASPLHTWARTLRPGNHALHFVSVLGLQVAEGSRLISRSPCPSSRNARCCQGSSPVR